MPSSERHRLARDLARDDVVHREALRRVGIDRFAVRNETAAGRWTAAGRHTVQLGSGELSDRARLWQAVWESGSGAALDGTAALVAAGLQNYRLECIDVSVPGDRTSYPVAGVRLHHRRSMPPVGHPGPRVRPEFAAIHAAQWAVSARAAALVLCLPVQQRLITGRRLSLAWATFRRSPRRPLLEQLIRDITDGAHALGELDFARLCRRHRLPAPTRQALRTTNSGNRYLDAVWEKSARHQALAVEIDGSQHQLGLAPVDDCLRQNDVVLGETRVLRIPLLGLRLAPERFLTQVRHGLGLEQSWSGKS